MNKIRTSFLSIILITASFCIADTIIVDSTINGWYDHRGYSLGSDGDNSSIVGLNDLGGTSYTYNSYFIFSVPELTDEIIDIQLVLELTGYFSEDFSENILISDVSTPVEQLKLPHTASDIGVAPEIYSDLMNGPQLGVLTVDVGTLYPFMSLSQYQNDGKGPLFSCSLNGTAIQMVTGVAGGTFAIGLSLMDIDATDEEFVAFNKYMGDPDYWVHELQITTIPEPTTILFLTTGIFFLKRQKT